MAKSIIVIGAGMGGLASGIYGQMNGYDTCIFEMHNQPGGQCTAWKRKGYTFDGCIHHLLGCSPFSRIHELWSELGAMPREQVYTRECVSVVSPEGKMFNDYWDPDELESHLKELSPRDAEPIEDYIKGIRVFAREDFMGRAMYGGKVDMLKAAVKLLPTYKLLTPTMEKYAARFTDPFLRRAFPLLEYSQPVMPFMLHVAKHAYGYRRDIAWPVGGALEFSRSIAGRYEDLGGEIYYKSRVEKILTEGDRAVGVRLEDGSEHRADIVISNADGRKTILDMLGGRYIDDRVRKWCEEPEDETAFAVMVFLGVDRDLSREPSALVILLDKAVEIAGHAFDSLEIQTYGFDSTMAPEGKGVIKVEMPSSYGYWRDLHKDKDRYKEAKSKVAETVIDLLEDHFTGIRGQVEEVDVPTIMTWERYMGGTHGFNNMPNKKINIVSSLFGEWTSTLPGLSGFYLTGSWATQAGALPGNAGSGRDTIAAICKRDGKRFIPTP
ncbi:MAG: NAD(P)/FAD-dependent oxidoreductase [Actinobacteria bacterium]|nr:NAD(P)/FAD-dependent oxidoreductase [Actinomycetota bacterium]